MESKKVYVVMYDGRHVGNVLAHSKWEAIELVLYSYEYSPLDPPERTKFIAKKLRKV